MSNLHGYWPANFRRADRRRFASLVQKACDREDLKVSGEIPDLVTDEGAHINLRNLLDECAALPNGRWSQRVNEWFSILASSWRIMTEASGMSPEVAEASLRIRLLPAECVPDFCVSRPSLPGLVAALYMARPGFGHMVNHDMFEAWGLDIATAFDRALDNSLENEVVDPYVRDALCCLDGASIYSSTQALSLCSSLTEPVVLGIPTCHSVVFALVDPLGGAVAEVLAETAIQHSRGPGPTSCRVWFVEPSTSDKWGEGAEAIDAHIWADSTGEPRCKIQVGPRLESLLESATPAA